MKNIFHYLLFTLNYIILLINRVEFSSFKIYGVITVLNRGHFFIGKKIRINSSSIANVIGGDTRTSFVIKKNASLYIGDYVSISNSSFYCANKITIDNYVMIGGSCKIWDSDFHPIHPVIRKNTPNKSYTTKPIHIKESAFIGGSSIILKGVTIGKNSVVGAGSVVSCDIPDNEIWAGNPARFIKKIKL